MTETDEKHHEECEYPRFKCNCEYLNRLEEEYREEPPDMFGRERGLA
jgi:hypothetical protein